MAFALSQRIAGINLLTKLISSDGKMFVEDTGSARTCLYLESEGWASLYFNEGLEVIEITEEGRKVIESAHLKYEPPHLKLYRATKILENL